MIKIGQRKNLLHPFMLALSYLLIKLTEDNVINNNYKIGKLMKYIKIKSRKMAFSKHVYYYF